VGFVVVILVVHPCFFFFLFLFLARHENTNALHVFKKEESLGENENRENANRNTYNPSSGPAVSKTVVSRRYA